MSAVAVIPARLGSTRFPRKVLADGTGWPLIRHVHEAAGRAERVGRVVVAGDDPAIEDAVGGFGGEYVATSSGHPNGSSRIAEACAVLGLGDAEVVVNVQGDEPEIDPGVIDAAVGLMETSRGLHVATVGSPFVDGEDPADPNIVKVVRRLDGQALYFSRALIPFVREFGDGGAAMPLKHVGLYAYRVRVLKHYAELPESPLERAERLEQLRFLERGYRVGVAVREVRHHGIDTEAQYAAFVERWRARARA